MINNLPHKGDILVLNNDKAYSYFTYYKGFAFKVIDIVDHNISVNDIEYDGYTVTVKMITPIKNCDKIISEYHNNLISFNKSELDFFEYAIKLWNESPEYFIKIPQIYGPDGYNHVCTGYNVPHNEQTIHDYFADSIPTYMYKRIDGLISGSVMLFGNEWFDKRCFEYCKLGTLNELKILSVLDDNTKQLIYNKLCEERSFYFKNINEINIMFTNLD